MLFRVFLSNFNTVDSYKHTSSLAQQTYLWLKEKTSFSHSGKPGKFHSASPELLIRHQINKSTNKGKAKDSCVGLAFRKKKERYM